MNRPDWATSKVKCMGAICWAGVDETNYPTLHGVDWYNDLLLRFVFFFHSTFILPLTNKGFKITVIEEYEGM